MYGLLSCQVLSCSRGNAKHRDSTPPLEGVVPTCSDPVANEATVEDALQPTREPKSQILRHTI